MDGTSSIINTNQVIRYAFKQHFLRFTFCWSKLHWWVINAGGTIIAAKKFDRFFVWSPTHRFKQSNQQTNRVKFERNIPQIARVQCGFEAVVRQPKAMHEKYILKLPQNIDISIDLQPKECTPPESSMLQPIGICPYHYWPLRRKIISAHSLLSCGCSW